VGRQGFGFAPIAGQRGLKTGVFSKPEAAEKSRRDSFWITSRRRVKDRKMATINQGMQELLTIDGALCAALVDSASGMILGQAGSGVDMEVAAAGNTEVVRAKMKTMRALGLNDVIEDILITLGKQYHIVRPMARKEGLFLYIVLDKQKSNLALARRKVQDVEKDLTV
jgi:hypothetical protein